MNDRIKPDITIASLCLASLIIIKDTDPFII